jgi:predicted heme/steroid binding protein
MIFWTDNPNSQRDVYTQKISLTGESAWPEAVLLCSDPEDQVIIGGVPSSDGNFILLLGDIDHDIIERIFMLKISPNGVLLWPQGGIVVDTGEFSINSAILCPIISGGAYVIYTNLSTTGQVFGNNYDSAGNPLWGNGRVLSSHNSAVELSQAVSDGEGAVILNIKKWYGDNPRSCLMRISGSGHQVGTDPLVNPNIFPNQLFDIGMSNNGNFIIGRQKHQITRQFSSKLTIWVLSRGPVITPSVYPVDSITGETLVRPTPDGGLAIYFGMAGRLVGRLASSYTSSIPILACSV